MTAISAMYPLNNSGRSNKPNKIPSGKNIVCVGGHPDDPESGCGGTLLLHAQAGSKVSIVYLTKGEAGIKGKSHNEAAAIRTKEASAAAAIIGADTYFAGQIDGDTDFNQTEIKKLQELLTSLKPDVLYTHWPLDTHPDHQAASLLSIQCWVRMNRSFELYLFEVDSGSQTFQFMPTHYIDITTVERQKKEALYKHKSQYPEAIYNEHHHIMQLFRGREIGVKEAEAFIRVGASDHIK
ncbi:MAG TPA: PIG-L family deacetylase [Flavitalea sp.]|nr:PIG-L family deacetylase [Flavitalea sp.]